MNIRLNDDYYFLCCDWCDSENLILWAKLGDDPNCGACHRPLDTGSLNGVVVNGALAAGLC